MQKDGTPEQRSGELIRARLKELGLPLRKVARDINVPSSTFSDCKSGKHVPSDAHFDKIAAWLGLTPESYRARIYGYDPFPQTEGDRTRYAIDTIRSVPLPEFLEIRQAVLDRELEILESLLTKSEI